MTSSNPLHPKDGGSKGPPKRWYLTALHGVTTQKTVPYLDSLTSVCHNVDPASVHTRFVVDTPILGQASLRILLLSPANHHSTSAPYIICHYGLLQDAYFRLQCQGTQSHPRMRVCLDFVNGYGWQTGVKVWAVSLGGTQWASGWIIWK